MHTASTSFGLGDMDHQFFKLDRVLTKVTLDGAFLAICTPNWGMKGDNKYLFVERHHRYLESYQDH